MINSSTEHKSERPHPRTIGTDKQIMMQQNGRTNIICVIALADN